jgi:hypothetical protein
MFTLVHHGEAVVRERLIVHQATTYEKATADVHSDGSALSILSAHYDHRQGHALYCTRTVNLPLPPASTASHVRPAVAGCASYAIGVGRMR